jgi:hypothetical protein
MNRDQLFFRVTVGLLIIVILYGAGMLVVVLIGNAALALRMLNLFGTMFTGALGFITGYLLGRRDD